LRMMGIHFTQVTPIGCGFRLAVTGLLAVIAVGNYPPRTREYN